MHLNDKELGALLVGVAVVLLLIYVAHNESDDKKQPRYEGELATAGLSGVVVESLDTGDHYFHPNYCVPGQTQIFTAHRYPMVSGGNITTLIHHGMDRLNLRAPQDDDWRIRPPAEVMW